MLHEKYVSMHGGSIIRSVNCLLFASTWNHPRILVGSMLYVFACFVCLRRLSCCQCFLSVNSRQLLLFSLIFIYRYLFQCLLSMLHLLRLFVTSLFLDYLLVFNSRYIAAYNLTNSVSVLASIVVDRRFVFQSFQAKHY